MSVAERVMRRAALIGSLLIAACGQPPTVVRLAVGYDPRWSLDRFDVVVEGKTTETTASPMMTLLVPDDWAGREIAIDVDGLDAGTRMAHGQARVTPELGHEVSSPLALVRVGCAISCELGAVECRGDGVVRCDEGADFCPAWSAPVACPGDAPYCSLGTCAATCVDDCAADQTRCDGASAERRCGEADSDPCRDWLPAETCSSGTCADGACSCPAVSGPFNIDIPMVTISGNITVNGAAITDPTNYGYVSLRNSGGDVISLGTTAPPTAYTTRLVPGTYDVYYVAYQCAASVPCNRRVKLRSVAITASATLDIDIPMVTVTGSTLVNGVAVTDTTNYGYVSLRTGAGDVVPVGPTSPAAYTTRLVPGTYDVYYSVYGGCAASVPCNDKVKLGSVALTASTTQNIDIPMVTVSGNKLVNGLAVADPTNYGYVSLRTAGGDEVSLGTTSTTAYTTRLVPGTYDVYYAAYHCAASVPCNDKVKLGSVALTASTTQNIDIPMVTVSGNKLVNGAAVVDTTNYGYVSLRTAGGDEVSLGTTSTTAYTTRLVPGTYDVYYSVYAGCAASVPCNGRAALGAVALTTSTTKNIDIPMVTVSGNKLVNGGAVADTTNYGYVSLRTAAGDEVSLGTTSTTAYTTRLVPGTYDVYYSVYAGCAASVPCNDKVKLGAVALTASTTKDVDIPMVTVSGNKLVNGLAVADTTNYGYVSLRTTGGDEVSLGTTYSTGYTTRLVPGTYDVFFDGYSGCAASVPCNKRARLSCATIAR